MMEYKIIETTDSTDLNRQVTEHLQQGWQLHGGVAIAVYVTEDRDGYTCVRAVYVQALVKAQE